MTFDENKNMFSETLMIFKDYNAIPRCIHCSSKLSYDKSISFISCRGKLSSGQDCSSRHGDRFKEVFEFNEEEVNELKEFSKYCQKLKPFIKSRAHYYLNAALPIKYAKSIKTARGLKVKVDSLIAFCEKFHDGYPHLSKEVSLVLHNPELSPNDIKSEMYSLTNDEIYLSNEAKDIFIF